MAVKKKSKKTLRATIREFCDGSYEIEDFKGVGRSSTMIRISPWVSVAITEFDDNVCVRLTLLDSTGRNHDCIRESDGCRSPTVRVRRTTKLAEQVIPAIEEVISAKDSLLKCSEECGDNSYMSYSGQAVVCLNCGYEVEPQCPECRGYMKPRTMKDSIFWGCSDLSCKRALRWQQGLDDELAEQILRATDVIKHPKFRKSKAARKLLSRLKSDPRKVLPLILGEKTPAGKPTLEARIKMSSLNLNKIQKGIRKFKADDRPSEMLTVIEQDESGGPEVDAKEFRLHKLPYEKLNPVQTAVLPFHREDINMVVAAATSAGKTTVAEMMMADALDRGGKAIFLSPLRAVSQEKYQDWTSPDHPWSDRHIEILTGDYSLTEAKMMSLARADIIVMTSEMLDSKTRRIKNENSEFLLKTMCLCVDEAHLLTMEGRGDALECGVMRLTKQNPSARVVFLSATMPNVDELGAWLSHLNGKPTRVIKSLWRPTQLDVHWPTYSADGHYGVKEKNKIKAAHRLLERYPKDKWIVFVHSKKTGAILREELVKRGEKAQFHSADLSREQRHSVEKAFRHGDLRIIVATSTLAYGINMPARRVLVVGVNRGISFVDAIDIKQMVGRAGRRGLDPKGDAYVLVPKSSRDPGATDALIRRYQKVGNIRSVLNKLETLAFHLTAECAEGEVSSEQDAIDWHDRSLAGFQGQRIEDGDRKVSASHIMKMLEAEDILVKKRTLYEPTMLGRVSSWLYYSPFDVSGWAKNLRRMIKLDRERSTPVIAWALGCVRSNFADNYLPKELTPDLRKLAHEVAMNGVNITSLPPACLAYYYAMEGRDVRQARNLIRSLQYDMDRLGQALTMVDNYVLKKSLGKKWFDSVSSRIKYGCSWEAAELCKIPGVGGRRAKILVDCGVSSIRDVATKPDKVYKAVGKKLGAKAVLFARSRR